MRRNGYSVFRRKRKSGEPYGLWYVVWSNGAGRRRTMGGILTQAIAKEIGRKKALDADRVRGGVVKLAELNASDAGQSAIAPHIEAWRKKLKAKGDTAQHVKQQTDRVKWLFNVAEITRLDDITADLMQEAIARCKTPQTGRHYLTALRTFIRFCIKSGKLTTNPILAVDMPQVAGETFIRHAFTDDEVARLIDATAKRKSDTAFRPLDRSMFYRLLAYTGIRKSEGLSLTPESFDLEKGKLVIEAAYSKHRRRDVLDLRDDLVRMLRPWLVFKKPKCPIFTAPKWANFNDLFARDCAAAEIKAAPGERLGLHSLRRWFITWAIRSSDLAVAQRLARHGNPALTAKYADPSDADLKRGLSGMPKIIKKSG